MVKLRYVFVPIVLLILLGLDIARFPMYIGATTSVNDSLIHVVQERIDSIVIKHSMRLPFGSTPFLQLYNDSLLLSASQTESYSDYEREANEFFGIDEKFYDTDIYLADKYQQSKRPFSRKINSPELEIHPAVSADGKLLVFSRKRNLKSLPRLFYSVYENSRWRQAKKLVFEDYKDIVYASYPHLTSDNSLYFAAGKNIADGELDIFFAKRNPKNWSTPENLGSSINTPFNEISPVQVGDSLLFFASDRPGGFGGYDLYAARLVDSFSYYVANLGEPFNTPMDDLYFLADTNNFAHGFIVRYTDSVKITPDLFAFKIHFESSLHAPPVLPELTKQTEESDSAAEEIAANEVNSQPDEELETDIPELETEPGYVLEIRSDISEEIDIPPILVQNETGTDESSETIPVAAQVTSQKVSIGIELLDSPEAYTEPVSTQQNLLLATKVINIPRGIYSGVRVEITD